MRILYRFYWFFHGSCLSDLFIFSVCWGSISVNKWTFNPTRGTRNAIVGYEYTMNRVLNYSNATVGHEFTKSPEQTGTMDENMICQVILSKSIAVNQAYWEIRYGWHTADIGPTYGRHTADIQLTYDWHTALPRLTDGLHTLDIRLTHGWYTADRWLTYGGYTADIRRTYRWYTADIRLIYGRHTADMRRIYGRILIPSFSLWAGYTADI